MTDDEVITESELTGEDPPRHIAWFVSRLTGEYYFRIKADNYKTIAGSEGYPKKDDMMDTIDEYFPEWNLVEDEDA